MAAVQTIVDGLRAGAATQVELTNYKQDGTPFRNLLSLQPVHDSNGVYRFCIGVLADVATLPPNARQEVRRETGHTHKRTTRRTPHKHATRRNTTQHTTRQVERLRGFDPRCATAAAQAANP